MAKKRMQVTIREDIVKLVDQEVEKFRFANRSCAIVYALLKLMELEKEKKIMRFYIRYPVILPILREWLSLDFFLELAALPDCLYV